MKKNFTIKDAAWFEFSGETVDLRGDYELVCVTFYPGSSPYVKMCWRRSDSNRSVEVEFNAVEDFIVKARDKEYPPRSGALLSIAGFTSGASAAPEGEFFVEPTEEFNYMSFAMDDMSIFLIKARSANMRTLT